MPTYAIVNEVLLCCTVAEASSYIARVPRAGAFILLLANTAGDIALIEATPRRVRIEQVAQVDYRANLFCFDEIKRAACQTRRTRVIPSTGRMAAIRTILERRNGRVSVGAIKDILDHPEVRVHRPNRSITIDQLIALPGDRTLLVRRAGRSDSSSWKRSTLKAR